MCSYLSQAMKKMMGVSLAATRYSRDRNRSARQGKESEQSADAVGVVVLAVVPDSSAGGGGLGGDVWFNAVRREYRINDVMQCVIGLCDRRRAEVQWLIIIL